MTLSREDLIKAVETDYKQGLEILKKKNNDYAGTGDAFKNFRFAALVNVSPCRAVLVRMSDKLARISNILGKENQVKDESIADTLIDLANYALILKSMIDNGEE